MKITSYWANKLIDAEFRGVAITMPGAGLSAALLTSTKGPRASSTVYALNDTISLTPTGGSTQVLYKCTTGGTTAASQGSLYAGAQGEVITDGTAVFTEQTAALRAGLGGAMVEASWSGYTRANLAASTANWAATNGDTTTTNPSSGTSVPKTSNNSTMTFGTAAASGPSFVWGVALMDATTSGNMLRVGGLAAAKTVNSGDPAPTYPVSALKIQIDD